MMRVAAYITSGRMVAYARQEPRGKSGAKQWKDSRECGGVYGTLEEWLRIVQLEQGKEVVSFRLEDYQ